jgi:DNA-binding transcriptional regulator LsrR (DeoR family)
VRLGDVVVRKGRGDERGVNTELALAVAEWLDHAIPATRTLGMALGRLR